MYNGKLLLPFRDAKEEKNSRNSFKNLTFCHVRLLIYIQKLSMKHYSHFDCGM